MITDDIGLARGGFHSVVLRFSDRCSVADVCCFETCAIVVAAGGYHNMVLTEEGCVWTKGWNKNGQLGDIHCRDTQRR